MATRVVNDPKAREKPCLRCGYSLRKLPDARHCPECGLSMWLSLNESDALDRSNPVWLRRLALAAWVLAAAHVLALAAWVTAWSLGVERIVTLRIGAMPFAFILIAVGGYAIAAHVGMLLLAYPENRHPDWFKRYRLWLLILGVAGLVLGVLLIATAFGHVLTWRWAGVLYFLWTWGALLVLPGGAVATLAYLRQLARRASSRRARMFCGWLMIVPLVMALPGIPCIGIGFFYNVMLFARFAPWAYLPGTVALFAWFAVMFRRSAKLAEREWESETARPT